MRREKDQKVGGEAARPAPKRLGYLDGMRALTALYVVAVHMGQTVWPRHQPVVWLAGLRGRWSTATLP